MIVAADRGAQADDQRDRSARRGHATACVRAGLFALVGTVLAALGHHAVAEGPFPWRLVSAFTLVQFGLIWPAARRRLPLSMILACTLAAQGSLHLALTWAGAATAAHTGLEARRSTGVVHPATRDGHAWHHASAAMTAAHVTAALLAGWLLHRADVTVSGALAAARTVRRVTTIVVGWLVPWRRITAVTAPSVAHPVSRFVLPAAPNSRLLHHVLVRRGPPGHVSPPANVLSLGCGHGLQPGIIS